MNLRLLICLCFFLPASLLPAQPGSIIASGTGKRIEIPFQYENNFIIVEVIFEWLFPMKFIFDTGAEHTIITKKEIVETLDIPYVRDFKIIGSDMKQELVAHLISGIPLQVGSLYAPNQNLLVLDDDYFRFEEFTGVNVHGILGANFFRSYVVKINYQKKVLTLELPKSFDPPERFTEIPVTIFKNKPYLIVKTKIGADSSAINLKMLLDTGASLSALFHVKTHPRLNMPVNVLKGNVGKGLGGYLEGYLGRAKSLSIGDFHLNEVLTNFQEVSESMDTSSLNGRHGILGNQILERFQVVINYPEEKLYLKPTKQFYKKFTYDRSGLILVAGGYNLNNFVVHELVPGSPAEQAGIKTGDIIKRVNWIPHWAMSLDSVSKILKGKPGKKVKLKIKRGDETLCIKLVLRDLI